MIRANFSNRETRGEAFGPFSQKLYTLSKSHSDGWHPKIDLSGNVNKFVISFEGDTAA